MYTPYPEPSPSPMGSSESTQTGSTNENMPTHARDVTPSSSFHVDSASPFPTSVTLSPFELPSPPDSLPDSTRIPLRSGDDDTGSDDEDPFAEDDLQDAEVVPAKREKLSPTRAQIVRDGGRMRRSESSPETSPPRPPTLVKNGGERPVKRMSLDELAALADEGVSVDL